MEPGAAYWLLGKHLPQVVPLAEVAARFRNANNTGFRDDILFPCDIAGELAELRLLAGRRGEPLPADHVSALIGLARRPGQPPVATGGDLARLYEGQTPGRAHRAALDFLLGRSGGVSPLRAARLFMALDLTIYCALSAAWYFKWAAGEGISLRPRPYEIDRGATFAILYDAAPAGPDQASSGAMGKPPGSRPRAAPAASSGTPRHPSYPSGHSTFATAASRVLEYFFSPETLELDDRRLAARIPAAERHLASPAVAAYHLRQLATNIGEARLWAGVNWRSDHSFGQRLGQAVADCVIEALRRDRIAALAPGLERKPTAQELDALRRLRFEPATRSGGHDRIPIVD